MPQDLLNDFRINAHTCQKRSCIMPQIMKMHARQSRLFQEHVKSMPNSFRPVLLSFLCAEDKIMVLPCGSCLQTLCLLSRLVRREQINDWLWEKKRAFTCLCFRFPLYIQGFSQKAGRAHVE